MTPPDAEWLLTDGYGGFAMGTGAGINTRRYHALLIHATAAPVGRVVVVHSLAEQFILASGDRVDLWTHAFGDQTELAPSGAARPVSCERKSPRRIVWTWKFHGRVVTRSLQLTERGVATVEYTLCEGDPADRMVVRPLMPLRSFHALDHEDATIPPRREAMRDGFHVQRDGVVAQVRATNVCSIDQTPAWWNDFAYQEERARGQDWREDVFSPGQLTIQMPATMTIAVSVGAEQVDEGGTCDGLMEGADRVAMAAEQLVVRRRFDDGTWGWSIIAGYPWFADWGRDAMIALPGLLLATDRADVAESVLLTFARHMQDGLIPNRFDDHAGPAHYNTVDASLWFVHAVGAYARHVKSCPAELYNACHAVVSAYRKGTRYGIRMEADGLVTAGDPRTQLTWMDAKRDGVVMTPRHGKAVEINALWHHALMTVSELSDGQAGDIRRLAMQVQASFEKSFWWVERGCLHDVLVPANGEYEADGNVRPNQIFAVSLRPGLLPIDRERRVVDVVQDRLLTPFGLRTLDAADLMYRGRYEGDLMSRDTSYHNGTVWPWLLGPFCDAFLHVNGHRPSAYAEVRRMWQPLTGEFERECVGQLAEIYDGDAPHRAEGCPAQAWSVAELLRVRRLVFERIAM